MVEVIILIMKKICATTDGRVREYRQRIHRKIRLKLEIKEFYTVLETFKTIPGKKNRIRTIGKGSESDTGT